MGRAMSYQCVVVYLLAALMCLSIVLAQEHRHDACRIHTDTAANWSYYPWRNAYVPTNSGSFTTHEYGYCSGGQGPWAWGSSTVSVEQCALQAAKMNATCFDFMCAYHEAANCTCPHIPPVTPLPSAQKVACVGDSITAGYLSSCGLNYPGQLQTMLGEGFIVQNYGVGGQTMMRHGTAPYWNQSAYKRALNSSADIVVLMLGTNDARDDRWAAWGNEFPGDYAAMVASFQAMASKPVVYIMVPPPLYKDGRYGMNQTVINSIFPGDSPAGIRSIAKAAGLPAPIDLYSLFQSHCPVVGGTPGHAANSTDTYCDWVGSGGRDGCHPDNTGYRQIAAAVKAAVLT